MSLRFISLAVALAWPLGAVAQPVTPSGEDWQQSYQALINGLTQANVSLNAQKLAADREIEKLKTEKAKPEVVKPEEKRGQ